MRQNVEQMSAVQRQMNELDEKVTAQLAAMRDQISKQDDKLAAIKQAACERKKEDLPADISTADKTQETEVSVGSVQGGKVGRFDFQKSALILLPGSQSSYFISKNI